MLSSMVATAGRPGCWGMSRYLDIPQQPGRPAVATIEDNIPDFLRRN